MDSLELPFDLIWEGKPEPLSPSQLALANAEDVLIFDNYFADHLNFSDNDLMKSEVLIDDEADDFKELEEYKQNAYELLLELQQQVLEEEDCGDEADQWLNQSMNFSSFAEKPQHQQPSHVQSPIKVEHTAQLIREFDSVYEVVELTHLTPPQTPPHSPSQQLLDSSFIHFLKQPDFVLPQCQLVANPPPTLPVVALNTFYVYDVPNTPASSPISHDIAHEMEVVEELVRSRAENLGDWTDEDDDDENSSSASTSVSSSSFSPRSESSYGDSNCSIDDEWTPSVVSRATKIGGGVANVSTNKAASTKRRSRPYNRSSEDKKSRKKEQNKNAATRYRQKKKAEVEVALDEERELQDIHSSLEVTCADVKREISYLKSLMREIYQAKGIL